MVGSEIMQLIRRHDDFLISHGVRRIGLFGSHVRGEERSDSDIDLIVEFKAGQKSYDNFIELCFFLEDLFGRNVDLLTPASLSPHLKQQIEAEVRYEKLQ